MNVMEELKAFALCAPPSAGLSAQARQLFYAAMEQRLRRPNETNAQYLGRVLTLAHCSDFLEAAKNPDLRCRQAGRDCPGDRRPVRRQPADPAPGPH